MAKIVVLGLKVSYQLALVSLSLLCNTTDANLIFWLLVVTAPPLKIIFTWKCTEVDFRSSAAILRK